MFPRLKTRKKFFMFFLIYCLIIFLNSGCKSYYAEQLIRKGEYEKAAQLLVTSENYLDKVLYNYAHARISYRDGNLKMADFYLSLIDRHYVGPFDNDIKQLKDEVEQGLVKQAFELLDKKQYDEAINIFAQLSLRDKAFNPLYSYSMCVKHFYDGDYKMAKAYVKDFENYSGYGADRVLAFRDKVLKEITPEKIREQEIREAKARKSQGVRIGMTQEEVLQSSWGKPKRINRTITAHGIHEQWVYDGGYLYFENGVLVAIQN